MEDLEDQRWEPERRGGAETMKSAGGGAAMQRRVPTSCSVLG